MSTTTTQVSGGANFTREHSERLRQIAKQDSSIPFPTEKLQKGDGTNPRVILIACGCFSPITFMHLRMFEQARDFAKLNGINVIGGYISPVTDAYGKKGLIKAEHRVKMAQLAVESSDWIMVDTWESQQPEYQTTIAVLEHFKYSVNKNNKEDPIEVRLVCGADLLDSFNTPGVWAPDDVRDILENFGIFVLERGSTNCRQIINEHDVLYKYQNKVSIIYQDITNEISSTKIRRAISRGQSVKYLLPDSVINYIEHNNLYKSKL